MSILTTRGKSSQVLVCNQTLSYIFPENLDI
jgi:hypothetical protein